MNHPPYIVVKMALKRGLAVNLQTIKSAELVRILPAGLVWDTDNGTWYVEDVFGDKVYSYEIINAYLSFVELVK